MAQQPTIAALRPPLVGRWRITGADCFDRDYLDLCGAACMMVPLESHGEMSFCALVAGLDFSFAPGTLFFDWLGSDELDERIGHGVIELTGADKAEIELEFSSGDVVLLNAVRISDG